MKRIKRLVPRSINGYRSLVESYIEVRSRNGIEYWRERVFFSVFFVSYAIGCLTFISGATFAISDRQWINAAAMAALTIAFGAVLFSRRLRYRDKTYIVTTFIYAIGVYLFVAYGPAGDSRLWLFFVVIIAALYTTVTFSIVVAVLAALTDALFGIAMHVGIVSWPDYVLDSLGSWMVVSFNLLALATVVIVTIRSLLAGLEGAFTRVTRGRVATVTGLAKLAEYRDTDTGEHLDRISEYSVELATCARRVSSLSAYVDDEYISDLGVSSLLHDIGKVGIPDRILLKPGKLTEREFDSIKQHPVYGARVIDAIAATMKDDGFLAMARHIARHHHEWWNGQGYPDGLSGEDIPLSARIVAIVDVFDALVSHRVYKSAMSPSEALAIIRERRGVQFDPALTDCFVEMIERRDLSYPRPDGDTG